VQKSGSFVGLAAALKEINAPVGALGLASLTASTAGLNGNDAGDATYNYVEGQLANFTSQRDGLAQQMLTLLEGAEFNNQSISDKQASSLVDQANNLTTNVQALANNPKPH
jgi:hypothetical protein